MRADGKIVKNVDPMYTLAPYFMRHRYDAQNMITVNVPYDNIHDYVIDARKRGIKLSHMTVVMAAIVRGFSQFPQLNRFVVNSKIYAHNELTAGMVVLRPGEGDPSMSKMKFDIYDTIFDVNDTINEYVEANNKEDSSNSSDKLFKVLLKMPFLVRIGMAILRGLDNLGWLPKAITDASPFHNSLVITNLASIRTNHIYHHVYGFGTTSMIISIGNNINVPYVEKGEIKVKKMMPLGIVMDERIATGCYFAQAFAEMEKYMKNPVLLETPPEKVNVDYEFEGLSERFKTEKTKQKEAKKAEKAKRKAEKAAEKAKRKAEKAYGRSSKKNI